MGFSGSSYFDFIISKISGPQYQFVQAILSNNIEAARKLAYDLYKTHPQYLTFLLFRELKDSKKILLAQLKKTKTIDAHMFYQMINSPEFTYLELRDLSNRFTNSSFINKCIKKAMIIKKYNSPEMTSGVALIDYKKNEITREIEDAIVEMDDFSLYKLALELGIDLKFESPDHNNILLHSINFQWYLAKKYKNPENFISIITKLRSFSDVFNLISIYVPDNSTTGINCLLDLCDSNPEYKILIKFLTNGYSLDLLEASWKVFQESSSMFKLKILLALLIASKSENYLVLAFYLTSSFYNFTGANLNPSADNSNKKESENYEIELIHMFLNRYFLFNLGVMKLYEKLDIKNIQAHNLAYIWSDPMIIGDIPFKESVKAFKNEIKNEILTIESHLKEFIEMNRIANAASLLNLRSRLLDSMISKEIESRKILSTESSTLFSDLLGAHCSFLFNKSTVNDARESDGLLPSLFSKGSKDIKNDANAIKCLLKNDLFPIEDPLFEAYLLKLIKSRSTK